MGTKQGPKRQHHIVPRQYLRGFTEPSANVFLWVYRRGMPFCPGLKQRSNPSRQSVRTAGAVRDYYALETVEGGVEYESYENVLERYEALGGQVLNTVRSRAPIDVKAKVLLSFYIEMMLMRVPSRAKHAAPLVGKALKSFPWDLLAQKAAEEGRFSTALQFTRDQAETRKRLEKQLLLDSMVRRSKAVIEAIAKMTWQFFVAPGAQFFVTSDNPAFFSRSLGLNKENSFLVFPISSQMALLGSRLNAADRIYIDATEAQMDRLNRLILTGAEEFAYACRPEPWILEAFEHPLK